MPRDLSPELRKLLQGTPWGEVFPRRPNPTPLAIDGRSVALRTLRRYLTELTFLRPAGRNPDGSTREPIEFRIPERAIQIGWPDYEKTEEFPSITFLHGAGNYNTIGLTSYVEETTRDVYGVGTVVQWMSEYQEDVILEVWANKKSELRSILAGIETALTPTEQMYGLRFRMPDYFDELVCFTIGTRQEFDDEDSARNRRHARITVEMRFTVVALVNYVFARPELKVTVDGDVDYGTAVEDEELLPSSPTRSGPCDPCG